MMIIDAIHQVASVDVYTSNLFDLSRLSASYVGYCFCELSGLLPCHWTVVASIRQGIDLCSFAGVKADALEAS